MSKQKEIDHRPVFKPSRIMRMVKKGYMPDHIHGGIYRCQKCKSKLRGQTEGPMYHENGMYVGCTKCKANVLYFAEFPPCTNFPFGFIIDGSGERKKYPLTFEAKE